MASKNDIQDFAARMTQSYNLAPPTHYRIEFLNYVISSDFVIRLNDSLESVIIPGRGHNTAINKTHGPIRDIPYEPLYGGEIEMTFRVSADYSERNYFERWCDRMIDRDTMKYNYYKDYIANIRILALDVYGNVIYDCEAFECFPKAITPISLAYSQAGELTRFSVSMAFRKYIAKRPSDQLFTRVRPPTRSGATSLPPSSPDGGVIPGEAPTAFDSFL